MQGNFLLDLRVAFVKLSAKIDPFLQILFSGCQLLANGKVAPSDLFRVGNPNLVLLLRGESKKLFRMFQDVINEGLWDTMVFHIKEADFFADFSYEAGSGPSIALMVAIRLKVNHFDF
jgi:hypothetical protein